MFLIEWKSAHWIDIVLTLAVALLVIFVIVKMIRDKKAGKSSCGCNCSGCAMAGKCKGAAGVKARK